MILFWYIQTRITVIVIISNKIFVIQFSIISREAKRGIVFSFIQNTKTLKSFFDVPSYVSESASSIENTFKDRSS